MRRGNDVAAHALAGSLPDLGELHQLARMGRGNETGRGEAKVRPVAFHEERAPAVKGHAAGILARHRGEPERIEPLQTRIKAPESGGVTA